MKLGAIISYICSIIFIGIGFSKLFVYENPDYGDSVNAYVGGDAYNYIINGNYATAYFTLAILCSMIGSTFIISFYFTQNNKVVDKASTESENVGVYNER